MTYHNNADANDERALDVVVVGTCVSIHDSPLGSVAPADNESHAVASLDSKLVMHVGISRGETREEKRRAVVVLAHRNPDMFRAWWAQSCSSTCLKSLSLSLMVQIARNTRADEPSFQKSQRNWQEEPGRTLQRKAKAGRSCVSRGPQV